MTMAITRDKYGEPDPPSTSSNAQSTITILHPGYSDGSNKLLILPGLDCGGVHYGTALTFCGIIASNSFDTGFFAKSREAEPETSEWDSVLIGPRLYFFATADRLSKYAVFTSYDDWPFQGLPLQWQNYTIPPSPSARPFTGLEAQLQERDRSCRLTLYEDGCEVAHLVPKVEAAWFVRNQMMEFVNAGDTQAIDHHANAILLRADLHHLMDKRAWVPMLKEGQLVICTICKPPSQPLSSQFRYREQNRALQELKGVSKECIFARIAWAVIPLVRPFLQLRWTQSQETTAVLDAEGKVRELTGAQLGAMYNFEGQPRSRRASPTKRARSELNTRTPSASADDANNGYNNACCSWNSFDSAYHEPSDDQGCETDEETSPTRGRKRRRTRGSAKGATSLGGRYDAI
ncbi:hypothetical protein F4825DRAFT_431757 [Nemania diffusa]|nr:hypothetical protein F4825DRAFT_431757 [Nemania diffusa]